VIFYLGTHKTHWLEWPFELALGSAPPALFVSRRSFEVKDGKTGARRMRRKLRRAVTRWGGDGGGFTELDLYGEWRTPEDVYAAQFERLVDEVGMMDFAAPQDWMCEPFMIAKTGLSIAEHQKRTTESVLRLRARAPRVPWIPVLQGYLLQDYLAHARMYEAAGVHLADESTVGVGSICRRQGTKEATRIVAVLADMGIRIHAFGAKTLGLPRYGHLIASSDSLAWSSQARHRKLLLEECGADPDVDHANCANCVRWAMLWRERVVRTISTGPAAQTELRL
jgi:hypothetical protein